LDSVARIGGILRGHRERYQLSFMCCAML
jgi:hypothetical protein